MPSAGGGRAGPCACAARAPRAGALSRSWRARCAAGAGAKGHALVGTVKSGALVEVLAHGNWLAETGAALRAFTRDAVRRHVGGRDPQSAAIVTAILIGDRVGLDQDVQRRLQEAGTYHVIAISGGNIAILAGVLLWGLRLAGAGHRAGGAVTMGVLIAYAALVGGGASVDRATLMAVIYLLARGRPAQPAAQCAGRRLRPDRAGRRFRWPTRRSCSRSAPRSASWSALASRVRAAHGVVAARAWRPPAHVAVGRTRPVPGGRAGLLPGDVRRARAQLPRDSADDGRPGGGDVRRRAVAGVDGRGRPCGLAAYLGAAGLVRSARLVDVVPWLAYRLPPPHWSPSPGTTRAGRHGSRPGRAVR